MIKADSRYQEGNEIMESASISAPFDEAKAELEKEGYSIITPGQFARLRIANGASSKVSTSGTYISMGSVMIPQKGRFFTPNLSLVMQNPVEATNAHRVNREFYVSSEDAERALASGSVQIPYNQSKILTSEFGQEPITAFVFGKTAKAYGAFLKEAGITAMPLVFDDKSYINSKEKPFANQAWLRRLGCGSRSGLGGRSRGFSFSDAVRGVREASASQGAKPAKNLGYQFSESQARKYLEILNGVRTGEIPASKLEEVVKAFQN